MISGNTIKIASNASDLLIGREIWLYTPHMGTLRVAGFHRGFGRLEA